MRKFSNDGSIRVRKSTEDKSAQQAGAAELEWLAILYNCLPDVLFGVSHLTRHKAVYGPSAGILGTERNMLYP